MTGYANLEIRILKRDETGYPVELTLDNGQQFQGGYLSPAMLPWIAGASPVEDGQRLFDCLVEDELIKRAWTQSRGQNPLCRIRLHLDAAAPELHSIPWELLHDRGLGGPPNTLAADAATPFSRYLPSSQVLAETISSYPLRLLVVIANPDNLTDYEGLTPVEFELEQQVIRQALTDLTDGHIELAVLSPPVTLARLEAELKRDYHLLHVIAHGKFGRRNQEAVLFLADEQNRVALANEVEFAAMLKRQGRMPRLTFLASCQSAARNSADAFRGLAPRLISAGIPAVLAMQDLVPVKTARAFTQTFYRRLLAHGQVDLASNEARSALLSAELPGSSIPVLFSRLPNNQLFDFSGVEPPKPRLPYEPETVLVPASPFLMGSDSGGQYEAPTHEVELSAYKIGKFPVTNRQYQEFIQQTGWPISNKAGWTLARVGKAPPAAKLDHPVVGISWLDAIAYCNWLSKQTGRTYRLPTEAEWEKAARGSDGRRYPWGNEPDPNRCNCNQTGTSPVTAYPAGTSPYGCFDMVGNVWEWTSTAWGQVLQESDFPYPYRPDDGREDLTTAPDIHRLFRGGSFKESVEQLGCPLRRWYAADNADRTRGFRVVLAVNF